tara:strand:- start:6204 stop:7079 length:876 start_codon:yes stop_codon:yes gene_type:complete
VQASEALSKSESLPTIIATKATELSYLDYNKNARALKKKEKQLITREYGDSLCFVKQHDHARVALDIFLLFSDEITYGLKNKTELEYAIRNHDCGWIEYDKTPKTSDTNQVYTFQNMKQSLQEELWLKSIANAIIPYSSLLIAEHFKALFSQSTSRRDVSKSSFNKKCEHMLSAIFLRRERPSINTDEFKIELTLLQVCDLLSLILCREKSVDSSIIPPIYSFEGKTFNLYFRKLDDSVYQLPGGVLRSKTNIIEIPYKMIDKELLLRPKQLKDEFREEKNLKFRRLHLVC